MIVDYFNFWHILGVFLSICSYICLYFLLRKRKEKTKKIVLFSFLFFALLLHFLKVYIPPYSLDQNRLYNDIWFINICAANILIFPFIFISKSKGAKDYMFYIGLLSGLISIFYPMEPILKGEQQAAELLDVIRFYIHHTILWVVPLLMVTLKLHKITYKGSIWAPTGLLLLMLFIILNQVFQEELGFIVRRTNDFLLIKFKNTSYIWGPDDNIGYFIANFTPDIFKIVPVGSHAGEVKYWPWFWLIVPAYILITPISFGISLLFDWKNFKFDILHNIHNVTLSVNNKHKGED